MTLVEGIAVAQKLLEVIAALVKDENVSSLTAADLLKMIKADEASLASGFAADDAAAQDAIDKKFDK